MSLDIYLTTEPCPTCGRAETVFDANITHNLGHMARVAGVYDCVWRPDENGIERALELIEPLRAGIAAMKDDPDRFRVFDSPNGWGLYENFLPWLEKLLEACEKHPTAHIAVSR